MRRSIVGAPCAGVTEVPERFRRALEKVRGWWRAASCSSASSRREPIPRDKRNTITIAAMVAFAVAVAMAGWMLATLQQIAPSAQEMRPIREVDAVQRRGQQPLDRAEAVERAARKMAVPLTEERLTEERRAFEVAERAAREAQAQLNQVQVVEKTVAQPARPPPAPTSQLLSVEDLKRVTGLADQKQLPLPSIRIRKPASEVPENMRRFVGIWVSDSGFEKTGRQYMLIVTNVLPTGQATGFHIVGPPQTGSTDPARAAYYPFVGRISENELSIKKTNPDIVGVLSSRNELDVTESWKNGLPVGRVVLKLVWRLVEAERTTKQ
jgi:hypothetical protein